MTTTIESAVTAWPGIEVGSHRFAGREFTVAGQEIGHVHGDRQADIPFPKRVRDIVVREGRTSKHHLFPESGWVTKYLESPEDVEGAVWLFRLAYLYKVAALQRRDAVPEALATVDVASELATMGLPEGLREVFPGMSSESGPRTPAE